MIPKYHEKSVEVELHSDPHRTIHYEGYTDSAGLVFGPMDEDTCECHFRTTVQAEYDWQTDHKVRLQANSFDTFHSNAIWLTANQARQLATMLTFAANDADQLNKDFPTDPQT